MTAGGGLLTAETVVDHLRERGVIGGGTATARALSGGVSNVVLAVDTDRRRLVVKQSLDRLRVADDWFAPRHRILNEATALGVAAALTPEAVPAVLDVDPARFTLTVERAPEGWTDWRWAIFDGQVVPALGGQLGAILGTWHAATAGGAGLPEPLATDTETFRSLRVQPYHETLAARHPEVRPAVDRVVERMLDSRLVLVHGDFSPKNVLAGAGGAWVIDFEVAHLGDPTFDLAFLLTHLLMKAVHRPELADRLDAAGAAFLDRYRASVPGSLAPDLPYLSAHVGCLLLARVAGKSPADYLDRQGREAVWRLGLSLLHEPVTRLADLPARRARGSHD